MLRIQDVFNARVLFKTPHGNYWIYRLDSLEKAGLTRLDQLPFSIRILLESVLRQCNEREFTSRGCH